MSKQKLKLVITNPVDCVIYEMELDWSHDQIEKFNIAHNVYIEGEYTVEYRAQMDDLKLYPKRSDAKLIRGTSIDKTNLKTDEIISMLCDRGGFDDWWHNIDEDIQDEIKEEILNIIKGKNKL